MRAQPVDLGELDESFTGDSLEVIKLGGRIAQVLVGVIFVGWALSVLGADLGWLTVLIVICLFIGFVAVQPLLEGLGASLIITSRPAFSLGDEIEVDGYIGEVIEITSRSTVLRHRDGRRLHLPNADILANTVTVYTIEASRRSSIDRVSSIRAVSFKNGIELSRVL